MAEINAEERSLNFLEEIVEEDLGSGKYKTILTRFPPEPNGYLHIGHAKSICLNFGLALKYGGKTNLRFDDTNPAKEETEYVDSIIEDVRWLGFEPEKIREALDIQLSVYDERQRSAARVWEAAGGYSPTIGILGAVLGLIHVMENMNDPSKLGPGIAVAFVATIYGVALANLIFLPISNKLKTVIRTEITLREMLQDGLIGIAHGEHPRLISARMKGYME